MEIPSGNRPHGSEIPSEKSSRILNIVLVGISCYLAIQFCLYIQYAANMAVFPYEVDSGEGLSLHRALSLSRGQNIYSPIDRPPYTVANYPPIYDFILAAFFKIAGPGLLIGRLVSIISTLAAGFLIGLIIWLQTGKKISSVMGALLFFSSGWVTSWSVLSRIDMLALLFSLAGLFFFIVCMRNLKKPYLYLAIACLIAALFTRQSAVCVPVACMLTLIPYQRRFKTKITRQPLTYRDQQRFAATFVIGLMGGGLTLFGFLMVVTRAEFWHHVVTYTAGPLSLSNFYYWFHAFMWTHGIAVLLSAVTIIFSAWKRDVYVYELYWLFALLMTFAAGKLGASINYFLEFWAASCLVTGLVIAKFQNGNAVSNQTWFRYGLIACVVLQLFQLDRHMDRATPSPAFLASNESIHQLVHDTKGNILSEYTGYLALDGHAGQLPDL